MKLLQATVSSKGQVTLPKEMREQLNLVEGSRVQFIMLAGGDVRMIPKTRSIMDAAGMLSRPRRTRVSLEDMERGIAEGAIRGAFDPDPGDS